MLENCGAEPYLEEIVQKDLKESGLSFYRQDPFVQVEQLVGPTDDDS
jgi:hypothetical protein